MRFVHESLIPAPVEQVFAFHERADAFALLQPPWERVRIIQPPSGLEVGTRVELDTRIGPFWVRMTAEHLGYEKNRYFEDELRGGPFAHWRHRHCFLPDPAGCRLRDEVEYRPRGWLLGRLIDPVLIRPRLLRMFRYRHEVTQREVLAAAAGEQS